MKRLIKAVEKLLPYIHENSMNGETEYERAVMELEAAFKEAAQQSEQAEEVDPVAQALRNLGDAIAPSRR